MMDQDRITQYIHSLDRGHGAFCDQIAKTARAGRVPVIRKETAVFLQTMVASKQPKHILEVGTAQILLPLKNMNRAFPWHGRILKRQECLTGSPF